ncbi:MAG TPA: hypothetical protein VN641_04855, partial [Urbifossiella sp.]|nr:hypothetical protein [Urbifossiella sp.]
ETAVLEENVRRAVRKVFAVSLELDSGGSEESLFKNFDLPGADIGFAMFLFSALCSLYLCGENSDS